MINNKIVCVATWLTLSIILPKFPIENKWEIEIPNISLKAEIGEGTTKEVMDEYVGHFSKTSTWSGNICLAAHNRGYKVNYFRDLKDLKIGDEIIYHYKLGKKVYKVNEISVISDEDWSYINSTMPKEKNTITLITCVENMPALRRCIQGIEVQSNLIRKEE